MTDETTTRVAHHRACRRVGTFVRIGLAAVGLLGIGTAATTAAWTGSTSLPGSASAATVELQGAADTDGDGTISESEWKDADDSSVAIVVPAGALADLVPGQVRSVPLHLRNTGTAPLSVRIPPGGVVPSGDVFTSTVTGAVAPTVQVVRPEPLVLAAAGDPQGKDRVAVTLTVTTPDPWHESFKGRSGTVSVVLTGQTVG